ncbi:hypothetical protein TKK_0009176 [Trichogramma kaykai]
MPPRRLEINALKTCECEASRVAQGETGSRSRAQWLSLLLLASAQQSKEPYAHNFCNVSSVGCNCPPDAIWQAEKESAKRLPLTERMSLQAASSSISSSAWQENYINVPTDAATFSRVSAMPSSAV